MTTMAATAAASTNTEVSMRSPCQVMATSPGRSASHTAPNPSAPTIMRYKTTRILPSLCRPAEPVGGKSTGRGECGAARLRLFDPSFGRRSRGRGKLRQLGKRAGNIALRRLHLDARNDRAGTAAGSLLQRMDAHEL